MRRTIVAMTLTVVGLYLVLSFKTSPLSRTATPLSTPAAPAPTSSSDNTTQPPAGPPPPPDTTGPPATAETTTTITTRLRPGIVKGPAVYSPYGDVQVQVTVGANSRITDVQALQLPFDRPRSQFISEQAAPLLKQEVLTAQSAQIDTISGATYTAEAYAQSLQAALDSDRG